MAPETEQKKCACVTPGSDSVRLTLLVFFWFLSLFLSPLPSLSFSLSAVSPSMLSVSLNGSSLSITNITAASGAAIEPALIVDVVAATGERAQGLTGFLVTAVSGDSTGQ